MGGMGGFGAGRSPFGGMRGGAFDEDDDMGGYHSFSGGMPGGMPNGGARSRRPPRGRRVRGGTGAWITSRGSTSVSSSGRVGTGVLGITSRDCA